MALSSRSWRRFLRQLGFRWTMKAKKRPAGRLLVCEPMEEWRLLTATVSMYAYDADAGEPGNPGEVRVELTSPEPLAADLVISYSVYGSATAGSDYVAPPGSVTFAAGTTSGMVAIPIAVLDDAEVEGDETLDFYPSSGGPGYTIGMSCGATVVIHDDDVMPTVTIEATDPDADESGSNDGEFRISRTGSTAAALEVFFDIFGAAEDGVDYSPLGGSHPPAPSQGMISIPVGANQQQIDIVPIIDAFTEQAEDVILVLYTQSGWPYLIGMLSTATVTIASEVNDPPVAGNDALTVGEDGAVCFLAVDLLANDSPGPAHESNQTLSVTAVGAASHGVATLVAGGTISYTPNVDYFGSDSFTYTVIDNGTTNGAADPKTATGTVTITVTKVNDPPIAVADTISVDEDQSLVIPVLANDSPGPANEMFEILAVTQVGQAANGIVLLNNGVVTYTPNSNYHGTDAFTYTVTDNGLTNGNADPKTATATVTVTVAPKPDPVGDIIGTSGFRNNGQSLTTGVFEMAQGDMVQLTAIPAPGATFEPGEPIWILKIPVAFNVLTYQLAAGVASISFTFSTFHSGGVQIHPWTPSTGSLTWPVTASFDIIPHPVGITNTQASGQTYLDSWGYGTDFIQQLVPSVGATGDDLYNKQHGFAIKEEVLNGANPFHPCKPISGSDFPVTPGGYLAADLNTIGGVPLPDGTQGVIDLNDFLPDLTMPQTYPSYQQFHWLNLAADSGNHGVWTPFVVDNLLSHELRRVGNSFQVVTSNNGVEFVQPYLGPGIQPIDVTLQVPGSVPHNSTVQATVSGKMLVSQHDVTAGFMSFDIKLYDQDVWYHDLIGSAQHGLGGALTPGTLIDFTVYLDVVNLDGEILGSGELEAELFATVYDPTKPGNEVWTLIYEVVAL